MSSAAMSGDQATVTVSVAVPPAEAFRIFTEEIELWWRRGPRYRNAPGQSGIIAIEPRVGGRVFEAFGMNGAETVVQLGTVMVWEPGIRLAFEWRNSNFAPDERTEVDVRFESFAGGTRVTVVHRGWAGIRSDHPARHGLDTVAFIRMNGLWWGDLLSSLRLRCRRD
jgi:uncharacterized protein YndB with AHSA1/START domain